MAALVLDAVEIYNTCVDKTRDLVDKDRLRPAFRELVAVAMIDMMAHFAQSAFLDPGNKQMINFFISALRLLQSVCHFGYKPCLDAAALGGLWHTLDAVISAIDSAEIEGESAEEIVLKTLESISEWLPVKFGAYSPMIGLEAHPQIVKHIISRFANEAQKAEGRLALLVYKNRFRWFSRTSGALRAAWMNAGLGSHLVDALRRPDIWKGTAILVRTLEDITETSADWCLRLVADGFLTTVAEVILHFDQAEDSDSLRRIYIQCRLTRALISVWRHCSAIPEINWPMEKMLAVVNQAGSATGRLLRRDATRVGLEAQPSADVAVDKDAVCRIRDNLISFVDWTKDHLPTSTPTEPVPPQGCPIDATLTKSA